ncbi:hypothetical protein TNCV_4407571 [Trichonephila clavipes]|nr:hypothetical protein TNCV_4407571 [Trichonephila clavipes]
MKENVTLSWKTEPIFKEEIPALYGQDMGKVELHGDKASSHMSKSYLAKKDSETGIKCIKFDEIPVKSSEASPTDFYAFNLLK